MFEIIIGNLIKIGYAMAIFLCAYLATSCSPCGTTSRSTVNPSAAKAGDRRPEGADVHRRTDHSVYRDHHPSDLRDGSRLDDS